MSELSEREYLEQLNQQKHMYCWCLVNHGSMSSKEAQDEAEDFYPYQPETESYRWLVFHDDAWHWAMLKIHGEQYWQKKPKLLDPCSKYEQEMDKL